MNKDLTEVSLAAVGGRILQAEATASAKPWSKRACMLRDSTYNRYSWSRRRKGERNGE